MTGFLTLRLETMFHPLGPDLRTVVVPMVLQVRPIKDADALDSHPIWSGANLTDYGRALPRKRRFKAREIRQPGETEASALVVSFARGGSTKQPKRQVLPKRWIWEDEMSFILEAGKVVGTWQGGIEQATRAYVDHLVSPEEYGPSRKLKPLTQEELDGFRDRAANAS